MAKEVTNSGPQPSTTVSAAAKSAANPRSMAMQIAAIRPEETLAPLRALWSAHGNTPKFYEGLAQYTRGLLGAVAVTIYEQQGDVTPVLVGLSCVVDDRARQREYLPEQGKLSGCLKSLTSLRYEAAIERRQNMMMLTPFALKDGKKICLAAVLPPERIAYSEPCFVILHLVTQFLVQRELLSDAEENSSAFIQATLLVEMFSRTSEAPNFPRALFTLTNELEKFFDCNRVAIGVGNKKTCKMQAISGLSSDDRKGIGMTQLSEVMREAISLEKVMVWPAMPTLPEDTVVSANHDDLLHTFKSGAMMVAPLYDHEEESIGAIALLWPMGAPPEAHDYRLLTACQPHLASLIGFLKKSKPGRMAGAVGKLWSGSTIRKVATLVGLVVALGIMFLPITYRLPAECRLQPVLRRSVAAPFDATLDRGNFKPGQVVKAGEVLAELEGREIRVQLSEAIAARGAAMKKRDSAMVMEDPSSFQMAQLEADKLDLEVKRLSDKNSKLKIRSPLDGVVLTGSLERSEGVPVSMGQKLFEVAPLKEMLIEVAIPEGEIRYVEEGARVKLRLESDATRVWESVIDRIHPVSEIQDGKNVFIAEANIANDDSALRPGMGGSVRILTEQRSIGWILFHRLWDYLRLKLW